MKLSGLSTVPVFEGKKREKNQNHMPGLSLVSNDLYFIR